MTLRLAWRNLWRHPRRTLLSVGAIAATCTVVVFLPSLQAGSYSGMVRTYIDLLDGYAQVQDPAYLETPAMRDAFSPAGQLHDALKQLPEDVHSTERGVAYALLSSDRRSIGARIIGVAPRSEALVSSLPRRIVKGEFLASADQVVLGEALARNLQVKVGDHVNLLGVGLDGSLAADALTVSGIFRTGINELDRSLAEIPLARFDATFAMAGRRHAVVINGRDTRRVGDAVERIRPAVESAGLALRDWRELQPSLEAAIRLDASGAVLIYAVLIAVVVVSLLNTLLMSVLERTREFGMTLAIGVKPGLLGRVVWGEIGLLTMLGIGAGLVLGSVLTLWFQSKGVSVSSTQAMFEQYGMSGTLYPDLTLLTLLVGPAAITLAILVAGVYPAFRIRRLRIIDAMRSS